MPFPDTGPTCQPRTGKLNLASLALAALKEGSGSNDGAHGPGCGDGGAELWAGLPVEGPG